MRLKIDIDLDYREVGIDKTYHPVGMPMSGKHLFKIKLNLDLGLMVVYIILLIKNREKFFGGLGLMEQIFFEVIKDQLPRRSYEIGLFSKVFVWSADYECEPYFIYDTIPEPAAYFWANVFEKKLYKFEKVKGEWKLVEEGSPLTPEGLKRIRRGPAFKGVPPVLDSSLVLDLFNNGLK